MTKAELVRSYIRDNPNMTPLELARKIRDERPALKVTNQDISAYKTELRRKKMVPPPPPPPAPEAPPPLSESLRALRSLVRAHGKEELKKVIDLL